MPKVPDVVLDTQYVAISPEMASRWLEMNTRNRRVNKSLVDRYARDMAAGRWRTTHQGIAFDRNGVLLDGQHRLMAIVAAGVTVTLLVSRGIDPGAQKLMDCGPGRKVGDSLTLDGGRGHVTHETIAVLRAMLRGMRNKSVPATVQEIGDALDRHREAIDFSFQALSRNRAKTRGICSATTRAVIARAWYSQDEIELRRFCDIMSTGMPHTPDDVGAQLVWKFLVTSNNNGQGQILMLDRYARTQRGLWAFLQKERITRLLPVTKEMFPLPEEVDQTN